MLNLTLASLVLSSHSPSPFFQISRSHQFFSLSSSKLTRFCAPFLALSAPSSVHLKRSHFSHFLDSSVKTVSEHLLRLDYKGNHTNFSKDPELVIEEMTFTDCTSQWDGGAVFVIFESFLICNYSAFANCWAGNKGGAVFCVTPVVNFTGSCFQNCSARLGCSVYSPDCEVNMSFQGCVVDQVENQDGSSAVLGFGREIVFSDDNFSSITVNKDAVTLETDHSIQMYRMTFDRVSSVDGIVSLARVQNDHTLRETNVIGCKSDGCLIVVHNYNPVFVNYVFVDSACEFYFNVTGNLIVSECVFDHGEEKLTAGGELNKTVVDCEFNNVSAPLNDLGVVSTQQCWFHSRYIWRKPKLWVQIVVGLVIALILVGGLLGIVIHSCLRKRRHRQEKEKQKRMKGWCARKEPVTGVQAVQQALMKNSLIQMAVRTHTGESSSDSSSSSSGGRDVEQINNL